MPKEEKKTVKKLGPIAGNEPVTVDIREEAGDVVGVYRAKERQLNGVGKTVGGIYCSKEQAEVLSDAVDGVSITIE